MVRFKRQSRPVEDGGAIRSVLLRVGPRRGWRKLYFWFIVFGFLSYRLLAWFFGWE